MGRIHILADQVANRIAAGEVVERPASVVKELLENALDAGAGRLLIEVQGGGRKLIHIADDGCGMVRDDALLAFERHATSKLRSSDDLLAIATLGFRGEALPSIASVSRLDLATRSAGEQAGTRVEIHGGKVLRCEDDGIAAGTSIAVRDLFFNTPARRKFLKSETTELSHITALVTHYALAHPEKRFELRSATHALLIAPPVSRPAERIFQIFGEDTLDRLLPLAAEVPLERAGLPEPPPWKRDDDRRPAGPGLLRISGFISKPELQKLNRNSIYCFVNRRLVRDRVLMHAVIEAYRNVLPQTCYPVALVFLELPSEEVDVNVHPAKTEVRFRQPSFIHDFVRDSIRNKLTVARPAASFLNALASRPSAVSELSAVSPFLTEEQPAAQAMANAPALGDEDCSEAPASLSGASPFLLSSPPIAPREARLPFEMDRFSHDMEERACDGASRKRPNPGDGCSSSQLLRELSTAPGFDLAPTLASLRSLKPIGQLRESFILAVNEEGLWIIDQHVAHERVLFERVLQERASERVERQRLLMPMLLDLLPAQMVVFAGIAAELEQNGFEVEPFGPRTVAVKSAPAGLDGRSLERMLVEVVERPEGGEPPENLEAARTRIAASVACHAAIKVNTPLDGARMEWLLGELAKTEHPTSCPHGRPIALRYSWKEILRAFHRI